MTWRCLNSLTLIKHATGLCDSSATPDWLAWRARPTEVRCQCCRCYNCQLPAAGKKDEPQHLLQGVGSP